MYVLCVLVVLVVVVCGSGWWSKAHGRGAQGATRAPAQEGAEEAEEGAQEGGAGGGEEGCSGREVIE